MLNAYRMVLPKLILFTRPFILSLPLILKKYFWNPKNYPYSFIFMPFWPNSPLFRYFPPSPIYYDPIKKFKKLPTPCLLYLPFNYGSESSSQRGSQPLFNL